MKQKKLKRLIKSIALGACLTPWAASFAASQETVWGSVDHYSHSLQKFSVGSPSSSKKIQYAPNYGSTKNKVNTLQFGAGRVDDHGVSHVRYDQYYEGIPVWHSQVIYHVAKGKTNITGSMIHGIEEDVTDLQGKLSIDQVKNIAIGKNVVTSPVNIEKVIYYNQDQSTKAVLAYHVSYILFDKSKSEHSMPTFIIDANTGDILEQSNALPTLTDGVGLGGVQSNSGSPIKEYQFGNDQPGLNKLGPLPVKNLGNGICTISNPLFRVMNLKNLPEDQLGFSLPASTADETAHQLTPFVYNCGTSTTNPNNNDNGYAPVNSGISPVNDVTYFVRHTINMFKKQYGLATPAGPNVPFTIYTHVGDYDNAFACGTHCMSTAGIVGPPQLVFGNGQTLFSPLTEGDVVAHEFGHLVTDQFSGLTYSDQSGGINEAFSDMTGMAFNSYLRKIGFTWYWNGLTWSTGSTISKSGLPIRSFSNPTSDGNSIDNAASFQPGMNPHYSSGVYNKAFYLLSTTPGWSIEKAYQIMLDANMHYWSPSTNYNTGACGVLEAAAARGYSTQPIINAFKQVGVTCPNPV